MSLMEFLALSTRMGLETNRMPPGDFSRPNVKATTTLVSSVFTSKYRFLKSRV